MGGNTQGLYDPSTEHDACGVGFVAHTKGVKSRGIVQDGLQILERLRHRGATGYDPHTGDGAGILLQLPHRFFKREGIALGFEMPRRRRYGVGMVFLPADPHLRAACESVLESIIREEGQRVLGWRDVPINPDVAGPTARQVMPAIRQIYIARRRLVPTAFERKLYVIRKRAENRVREEHLDPSGMFHIASLSAETIVYKGLLLPEYLAAFYPDLNDEDMVSGLALVHSRFSTNTFPTWDLAQPLHFVAHNGEINTLRGNRNWMQARRSLLESAKFGGKLDRLFPIIVPGKSDSAQFDNMLELLHLGGRSLPHAMMMMIPEAHEGASDMDEERHAFYRYSSRLMEPWDGPAAIVFTDGHLIGATLDRNGLRPARYVISGDRVILSSEVGVVDIEEETITHKGRLRPGRMFVVDTREGRVLEDEEIKHEIAQRFPYGRWLRENLFQLDQFDDVPAPARIAGAELTLLQRAAGYTMEDLRMILGPMAEDGKEPLASMGSDTPLAVLSTHAPPLSHYFHQLFAQVTNPPIDPIRERSVMSLRTYIGLDGNTFEETPEQCHAFSLEAPLLSSEDLAKVSTLHEGVFEPERLSTLFARRDGVDGLKPALEKLCDAAEACVDDGDNVLILSDRGVNADSVAIPSLLALAAVHQRLVQAGTRQQCGLLVEASDVVTVHDVALLIGYGASAVNPYLALDTVRRLAEDEWISSETPERGYFQALETGLLKIMAKMGISTIASYRGAQIFEAVGLKESLIDAHFSGTPSRLGGIGLRELAREAIERHDRAFSDERGAISDELPVGGRYQWRRRGERHKWNPASIAKLQAAVELDSPDLFAEYTALIDEETDGLSTLRGQLAVKPPERPVALDEVEPASEIVKRFVTGAMSFGSISAEAHETLAIAMNRLGGMSNSGEGGEEPERFVPMENGDSKCSAIKQVASGRFGVTPEYLLSARDIQIKVAQGAKPGEGGQLPGHKVDERIARVRHSTPGVTLISPPPHHDIYSIEDLAQLIYDLKAIHPGARISVKLVSQVGVGTVAAGVVKAGADAIVIAGTSGGTGASPLSSIKHAGLPWELGLAETQQVLVKNRLRSKVRLQVDGGIRTGRDVVISSLLGAEEFGMATASLVALGCIMLRKCHLNTCSVGIATQRSELRQLFRGKPEHVERFFLLVAEDVRRNLASLGFRRIDEAVGRVDALHPKPPAPHWKATTLDVSPLLARPDAPSDWARRAEGIPKSPIEDHFDEQVWRRCAGAIESGRSTAINLRVRNTDRAVGARLSGRITQLHGSRGLPNDTVSLELTGSAGQSLGAFLAPGVSLSLLGDANDYLGKGMAGGRISVTPSPDATFKRDQNVIAGNVCLYGATGGAVYLSGRAGERFAIRNSGARAVVEGIGDHGCEYMTGGVVVVLGPTGQNFGAGMSGGVAYLFEREQRARARCNLSTIDLETITDDSEVWLLYGMIEDHVRHTGSALGERILDNWDLMWPQFVKVMPTDYKRVLAERRDARRKRMSKPPLAVVGGKGGA